jgi:hypothetical protein
MIVRYRKEGVLMMKSWKAVAVAIGGGIVGSFLTFAATSYSTLAYGRGVWRVTASELAVCKLRGYRDCEGSELGGLLPGTLVLVRPTGLVEARFRVGVEADSPVFRAVTDEEAARLRSVLGGERLSRR